MSLCSFCDEGAVYAHVTTVGVVWSGSKARLNWCRFHLILYYLALDMGGDDE